MNEELQNALFQTVQLKLPPSVSLVDELADVLKISRDSSYRRIRGDTLLNIQEIQALVVHYNISLDNLLNLNQNKHTFDSRSIDLQHFTISDYLSSILENLSFLAQLENNKITYSARDIPIFHYFAIPEIGSFKLFCWLKSYLNDPNLQGQRFDLQNLPDIVQEASLIGRKVWQKYIKLPCVEIWTSETIIVTLKQLSYYMDAGLFAHPSLGKQLLEKYIDLIRHIQRQAEIGRKIHLESNATHEGASFDLYYNEVAQGENTVLFSMKEKRVAFISYCTLNFLSTSNDKVCESIESYFQNLLKTSLLLSRTSEKERNKFFNNLVTMVNTYSNKL